MVCAMIFDFTASSLTTRRRIFIASSVGEHDLSGRHEE